MGVAAENLDICFPQTSHQATKSGLHVLYNRPKVPGILWDKDRNTAARTEH